MRLLIIPYKSGSASAKALADALGCKRVKLPTNDRWGKRRGTAPRFINWGNTEIWHKKYDVLNECGAVQRARDKLHTLRVLTLAGVTTVHWSSDMAGTEPWGDRRIFERHSTTGQGGSGIRVREPGTPLQSAPLYTLEFKAKHEYRVHVVREEVIDVQKKRRRDGATPNVVRNLQNGYVYCRGGVTCPETVRSAAQRAVAALGLDFGAVDILCKDSGECAVLEVNTAPGLEGTTVTKYAEALRRIVS